MRVETRRHDRIAMAGVFGFALVLLLALTLGACGGDGDGEEGGSESPRVATVRIASIESVGQSEEPLTMIEHGIAEKYDLKVEIVTYATPGQQYNLLQSGDADVTTGNFVDLLRQREQGRELRAFRGFLGYQTPVVVKPDSDVRQLTDLEGKNFGHFGTTFLGWLVLRASALRAYDFDIQTRPSNLTEASPPLLNELLRKGEIDAAFQFSSLTVGPVTDGEQRVVTTDRDVMEDAGFNPDAFYLVWMVTDEWVRENPGALERLNAALDEAYEKLATDDSLWPRFAELVGITDPDVVAAYRDAQRESRNPPYNASLIDSTQELLDSVIEVNGEEPVGVSNVDPDAFVFP